MSDGANHDTAFSDWILAITSEIWEGRGIGPGIARTYGPDVIVRSPSGLARGVGPTVSATGFTLAEFEDRTLLGEDVIWCAGEGANGPGKLSSHRLWSSATHRGGPFEAEDTSRRLGWRAIADCWAEDGDEGLITDEWLVRDNGALVRGLGHHPRDWAAREIAAGRHRAFTAEDDVEGPYAGAGDPGVWGGRLADVMGRMMGADFAVIRECYDRAAHLEYPGGVTAHGWPGADRHWLPLRASFPDSAFRIHHVIGRGDDPMMPPRAALRWSLTGAHSGWGPYGPPTGREVHVMGITHVEFGPFRAGRHAPGEWSIRREWTLYDECAVWMQVLGRAGAGG